MSDIVMATRDFHYYFETAFNQNVPILNDDMNYYDDAKLIIFSGGQDINPQIYGQENTHSFVNFARDSIELEILARSLKDGKKILGVCRGHQLVNAYLGGDMVQDLRKDLDIEHGGGHELVYTSQQSIIRHFFGHVNSIHHQGVIKAGKGLKPTTEFLGVIESCEEDKILTVQFHPEMMVKNLTTRSFFAYLKLWKEFSSNGKK